MSVWLSEYWTRPRQHRYPDTELIRFVMRHWPQILPTQGFPRILELGCGSGNNTRMLQRHGFNVLCHDLADHRGFGCKSCAADGWPPLITFDLREPKRWELPDAFCDVIVDIKTLQHITWSEHAWAFQEIHRLLKPHGRFFSVHLGYECTDWSLSQDHLIDHMTVANVTASDALYPNCGITCYPLSHMLKEALTHAGFAYEYSQIERLVRTDQRRIAQWWLVEAQK